MRLSSAIVMCVGMMLALCVGIMIGHYVVSPVQAQDQHPACAF